MRRIRLAQDVLNTAEEAVYDTLWNSKGAQRGDADAWRIVQAGYDALVKRTRLSRKTIQRIVERLLHKDFIAIERPADIYRRTSTTYRVFSYRSVLDQQISKGRTHAVKIGPGFVFAEPLEPAASKHPTTVDRPVVTTVDKYGVTTIASGTTPTVVEDDVTTVDCGTTFKREQGKREQSSSSAKGGRVGDDDGGERIAAAARQHGILLDADISGRLIEGCRSRDATVTTAEIAELLDIKIRQLRHSRSISNWPALLAVAVPRMVSAAELGRLREMRRAERAQSREMAEAVLADPAADPAELQWARSILDE